MSRKNKQYTPEFKIKVAKAYISGEYGGCRQIAKKFNITKHNPWRWAKQLQEKGESYFYNEKGDR